MRTWAIIWYLVAAVAESGGVVLIVLAFRENRKTLRDWINANPNKNEQGSWQQLLDLNGVVIKLLGANKWRQINAVALIVLGIVAGTFGNFASLPSH
jgi:hypothetical protein